MCSRTIPFFCFDHKDVRNERLYSTQKNNVLFIKGIQHYYKQNTVNIELKFLSLNIYMYVFNTRINLLYFCQLLYVI